MNEDSQKRNRGVSVVVASLVLVAAGIVFELGWPRLRGHADSISGARWIWSPAVEFTDQPAATAFYAVLDFELERADQISMSLMADELYVLHVNGLPVGSGGYRPSRGLDRYRLDAVIRPGSNRIIVELRSSRGAGGFIGFIEAGASRQVIAETGDRWRVLHHYSPALFAGDELPDDLDRPRIWGRPPTGRWQLGDAVVDRPLRGDVFPPPPRVFPERARLGWWPADPSDTWIELGAETSAAAPKLPYGAGILLDWGESKTGTLAVELTPTASALGLIFVGDEPPNSDVDRPAAFVLPSQGRGWWSTALDYTFRYALLVGVDYHGRAWINPSQSQPAQPDGERWSPVWNRGMGFHGLDPGPADALLEREVWARLGLPHPGGW